MMKMISLLLMLGYAALAQSPPTVDPRGEGITWFQMAGQANVLSASLTRPNDTSTYAVGDVVSNSTSAPAVLTFAGACRANSGSGKIVRVSITTLANQALLPDFELYLFSSAPTATNDNATLAISATDILKFSSVIPVSNSTYITNAGAGANGNIIQLSADINSPYRCAAADSSLYGLLVVHNAYVPTASEVYKISVRVAMD